MNHRCGTKVGGTFRAAANKINHPGQIAEFLRVLIKRLEMQCLGTHIYDVPIAVKRLGQTVEHDEGGITGVAVLSTSHAAIHTWPEECGATFDVHSCRKFPMQLVDQLIREMFDTNDVDIYELSFSLEKHRDI